MNNLNVIRFVLLLLKHFYILQVRGHHRKPTKIINLEDCMLNKNPFVTSAFRKAKQCTWC